MVQAISFFYCSMEHQIVAAVLLASLFILYLQQMVERQGMAVVLRTYGSAEVFLVREGPFLLEKLSDALTSALSWEVVH